MSVAVVIPSFNRREVTLKCLDAIYEYPSKELTIIVVDSGSTDGTRECVVDKFPGVKLVATDSNKWWAGATNVGIRFALEYGCNKIITYNDDNIATEGLFDTLIRTSNLYPDAIISSVCCYVDQPQTVFFAGRMRGKYSDRYYYLHHNVQYCTLTLEVNEVDLLHGMCTIIPKSVFQSLGLFDEKAFPHLYADDDLVLRSRAAGYRALVEPRAVVLNDRAITGMNPYYRKLKLGEVFSLLTSRRSVFEIRTHTVFLWRHRRSIFTFIFTWISNYLRLIILVVIKWILPDKKYTKIMSILSSFANR